MQPHGFWVYRGCSEAIVLVVSFLARSYGPYVVISEYGDDLILVTSETMPETEWTTAEWAYDEDDDEAIEEHR